MYYPNRCKGIIKVRRVIRANPYVYDDEWREIAARRLLKTRHPCSKMCCGHRRYWEGPTIDEQLNTIEQQLVDWR
jgi:hypothetical protein